MKRIISIVFLISVFFLIGCSKNYSSSPVEYNLDPPKEEDTTPELNKIKEISNTYFPASVSFEINKNKILASGIESIDYETIFSFMQAVNENEDEDRYTYFTLLSNNVESEEFVYDSSTQELVLLGNGCVYLPSAEGKTFGWITGTQEGYGIPNGYIITEYFTGMSYLIEIKGAEYANMIGETILTLPEGTLVVADGVPNEIHESSYRQFVFDSSVTPIQEFAIPKQ
ncbi:hypothetical protein [Faecalicoccus acidiformans]|uniref:Uncharacterized protein n=1 Tax=Faecalicoccus acidiformans TaxID=915173 RepID=A0ABS2FPR3_9FIRM|nr:hypothetical protein [Faecalicoccus acidiformans]MBM6832033.1 hypothetical protein [Faecalicoccus acidiformans]